MSLRSPVPFRPIMATVVALLAVTASALLAGFAPAATTAATPAGAPPAPFLPDSFVLARVNNRAIRVERFVDAYFASYGPVRPNTDSLGRVEFLNSMVNKEVMALTALAVNRPLDFEDRATMREHTERTLSNVLYQRTVLDSVVVSEDEIRRSYDGYGREQRYRRIGFEDPNTAAAVRRLLVAHTLTWNDAVRRYSSPPSTTPDGDMGWVSRSSVDYRMAQLVWDLEPGQVSEVVNAADGVFLMQLVERRKVARPAFDPLRPLLTSQLRSLNASGRAGRLQAQMATRIGMVYDSTNIRWAVARFQGAQAVKQDGHEIVLDLGHVGGNLDPADTSRVLARHRDGRLTLSEFLSEYNRQPPTQRLPIGDFDSFRARLDAIVLEPYMAEEARARGLEKDSLAVALVDQRREELLVDHLFADSVQSRVWIRAEDRKRYYSDHLAQFFTYPVARYAAIVRSSEAGAESIMARLKRGEQAAEILRADSLAGEVSGSIKEVRDEGRGGQYFKIIFGELRPGQATVVGPDKEGTWMVLQLLEFDAGRQLPYEQVESLVEESLQNIKAEEMLKALLARLKKRYRIESRPELVMRIDLVDPTLRAAAR